MKRKITEKSKENMLLIDSIDKTLNTLCYDDDLFHQQLVYFATDIWHSDYEQDFKTFLDKYPKCTCKQFIQFLEELKEEILKD